MRYEREGREPSRDDEMNQELGTTSVAHLSRTSRPAANRVRPFRADIIFVALWRIRIDCHGGNPQTLRYPSTIFTEVNIQIITLYSGAC